MTDQVRYLVITKEWDPYAGEGGEDVWRVHADLVFDSQEQADKTLETITEGLKAAGKYYAVGEVNPQ